MNYLLNITTKQDKTRQDKTRQDKTRQDKTRQAKVHTMDAIRILLLRDSKTARDWHMQLQCKTCAR